MLTSANRHRLEKVPQCIGVFPVRPSRWPVTAGVAVMLMTPIPAALGESPRITSLDRGDRAHSAYTALPAPAEVATPRVSPATDATRGVCGAVDITQSTNPNAVFGPGFGVACSQSANNCTVENEFARSFDLSVGPTSGQAQFVRCVEYGIEPTQNQTTGFSAITMNLCEDTSGGAPDVASLVLLDSIVGLIRDGTFLALRTVDFTANNVLVTACRTLIRWPISASPGQKASTGAPARRAVLFPHGF